MYTGILYSLHTFVACSIKFHAANNRSEARYTQQLRLSNVLLQCVITIIELIVISKQYDG